MDRVARQYEEIRGKNYERWQENIARACEAAPGLKDLLENRRDTILGGIRGVLTQSEQNPTERIRELNARIGEKLTAAGLPKGILDPVYTCPDCKDTGYLYDPSQRRCHCMEQAISRETLAELPLIDPSHTFEAFAEERIPETPVKGGTQRQMMKMYRRIAETFADQFPDNPVPNLVFMGLSGLGKTYLMECIAHRLAQRGILAEYTTAYRLLEIARQSYLENNPGLMTRFFTCPILMVDDLAMEPMLNNITITQLFNLINERGKAKLSTIFSTNYNLDELHERYNERITSRFSDPASYRILYFDGDDLRKVSQRG